MVSAANYFDWRARNKSFDAMSAYAIRTATLGGSEPQEVRVQMIGDEFFPMLGTPMALGRAFTAEENEPGAAATAILSDSLWRRHFHSDPAIIGKTIRLNTEPVTVVGVTPAGMLTIGGKPPDLWAPLRIRAVYENGQRASGRGLEVLARLRTGVSIEQADAEMRAISRQLAAEYPQFNANWSAKAVPLAEEMHGKVSTPLYVLCGAVAMILLIACANVANLMLARALGRQREMAIRASLGAGQGTLIRQALTESMSLAIIGGLLGIALAYGLIALMQRFGPADVRRLDRASIDGSVLLFTLGISLLTGLLLGLAPALLAARRSLGFAMRVPIVSLPSISAPAVPATAKAAMFVSSPT